MTQRLNGHTLDRDRDDVASDTSSSTVNGHLDIELKVLEKKKKDHRKARRGDVVNIKDRTLADMNNDTDASMDNILDEAEDKDDCASETTTVQLSSPTVSQRVPSVDISNPPPDVPVLAHYEIRPVDAKADASSNVNRQGLFATCSISEGTRIICEAPLISLPASSNVMQAIYDAYLKLSESDKDILWSLKPSLPPDWKAWSVRIDAIIPTILEIGKKSPSDRTEEDNYIFDSLAPKLRSTCEAWRVAARFQTHRYALTNAMEVERANIPEGVHVTGLFVQAGHLRHSCVPNCFCSWNIHTGRMTVHAVKNIAKGEELTTSCIGQQAFYYTRAERKIMLHKTANMTCACVACDASHPSSAEHETHRIQIHEAVMHINHVLTTFGILDHMQEYAYPNTASNEAPGRFDKKLLSDLMQHVLGLIKLLEKVGCTDTEIIRWRQLLRDCLLPGIGQWYAALAQAKLAARRALICWGPDYHEFKVVEGEVSRVENILAQIKENEKRRDRNGKNE